MKIVGTAIIFNEKNIDITGNQTMFNVNCIFNKRKY